MNGRAIRVDPVKASLVDIPERPFAELVAIRTGDFDPEHRRTP